MVRLVRWMRAKDRLCNPMAASAEHSVQVSKSQENAREDDLAVEEPGLQRRVLACRSLAVVVLERWEKGLGQRGDTAGAQEREKTLTSVTIIHGCPRAL